MDEQGALQVVHNVKDLDGLDDDVRVARIMGFEPDAREATMVHLILDLHSKFERHEREHQEAAHRPYIPPGVQAMGHLLTAAVAAAIAIFAPQQIGR